MICCVMGDGERSVFIVFDYIFCEQKAAYDVRISDWSSDVCSSDLVLPTLENFGLRVISQNPHEIRPKDGDSAWVQQFSVQLIGDSVLNAERQRAYFESAFLQTWPNETENAGLNRLVLTAGLDARQRAAERRVGAESVSQCKVRGGP